MQEKKIILTADIGGSHITSALIDIDTRTLVEGSWSRNALNSMESAEHIIGAISDNLQATMLKKSGTLLGIGIAMPGPMEYKTGVCKIKEQGKFASLYDMDLKAVVAQRLGIEAEPVHFINDAAAFLQGEIFVGALKGTRNALGITLGTGLGSAHAKDQNAEDSNLWCMPFDNGIAEDYLSSKWFLERFFELSGCRAVNVHGLITSQESASFLEQLFCEFKANLARFIDAVCGKTEVSAIVLGGNISLAEDLFLSGTQDILRNVYRREINIQRSQLGEEAALFGAAMICLLG